MMIDCTDFACPACGGSLAAAAGVLSCTACRASYPIVQGVPMLLPGLVVGPGRRPDPGFVDDLVQVAAPWAAGLPAAGLAQDAITDLFSRDYAFPERQLGNEGHRFVHRLRASGFAVREPYAPEDAMPDANRAEAGGAPSQPWLTLKLITAPQAVTVGQDFWVQVRIVNTGATPLLASGPDALALSYSTVGSFSWRTLRRRIRRAALTSQLLVDLPPGGALTQPVRMTAKDEAGPVSYRIAPVLGGSQWLDACSLGVTITGVAATEPDPLAVDWPYSGIERGYAEDHAHAMDLVGGWLQARLGAAPAPLVLELGGNAAPMLLLPSFGLPDARCYNADVDPFGLGFGTLQRRLGGGRAIQDLVADGGQLPFPNGSLHAIVMFATLHHFPDPVGLLRHLATKLAPGGLICACCEPVGHVSHDTLSPGFLDELLGGICEQAFQPWEWRWLFQQAGLRVVLVQHDCGSLKVALEPA